MKIDGGCHCGAITYEAEVDPEKTSICHCTDCQQLTGTAFRVTVPTQEDHYRITRGAPKIYIKTVASGAKRPRLFVPTAARIFMRPRSATVQRFMASGSGPRGSARIWFRDTRNGTARRCIGFRNSRA